MSTSPARILTVCTGNICRSPFLERALQAELDRSWGTGVIEVASGGTGALAGHAMDDQARAKLEREGYAADGFVARHLTTQMVADADLVLTATRSHRGAAATLHPRALRYVFSFREFAELVAGVPDAEVHAPVESAQEHITRLVALAAAQRGSKPPLSDADADIVDPYRRPDQVFEDMTTQIMAALPTVARALGRP